LILCDKASQQQQQQYQHSQPWLKQAAFKYSINGSAGNHDLSCTVILAFTVCGVPVLPNQAPCTWFQTWLFAHVVSGELHDNLYVVLFFWDLYWDVMVGLCPIAVLLKAVRAHCAAICFFGVCGELIALPSY
jgi:hypothetical protein